MASVKRSVPQCGLGSKSLLAKFQRFWVLHGTDSWLLKWPVRALVLLLVAAMPLGVELSSFFYGHWLCCAGWFVGDPAKRSVEVGVGVAVGCGQPWWIAGSGELAV